MQTSVPTHICTYSCTHNDTYILYIPVSSLGGGRVRCLDCPTLYSTQNDKYILCCAYQYVALGAFTLYGDTTVDEVISLLMMLALSIPKHDLIAFHKVAPALSLSLSLARSLSLSFSLLLWLSLCVRVY